MPILYIENEDADVHVWLDTEGSLQDGTIIGCGTTYLAAIEDAMHTLMELVEDLQQHQYAAKELSR